jgi:hypothetical protein
MSGSVALEICDTKKRCPIRNLMNEHERWVGHVVPYVIGTLPTANTAFSGLPPMRSAPIRVNDTEANGLLRLLRVSACHTLAGQSEQFIKRFASVLAGAGNPNLVFGKYEASIKKFPRPHASLPMAAKMISGMDTAFLER